jgi:dihydropteroate synthase
LRRVVPVVRELVRRLPVLVSVDTSKPGVMRAAVEAGAGLINDVYALRAPGALEAAAAGGVAVCLMHMQGEPGTMQHSPHYEDVVGEVLEFLAARMAACEAAGIPRERLLIDPGFGFGKTVQHNLMLLGALDRFTALGVPVLAGLSRKSLIGKLLDRSVDERLPASLALATIAVLKGARLIRAHDVAPTSDAIRIATAVLDPHYS